MAFDWAAFNKSVKKKFGKKAGKPKKAGSGNKGNAWRAYVSGKKR